MLLRRALTTVVGTAAALAIAAGPASAHFCYKRDVNPNAASGMAGSSNWLKVGDLVVADFGLCQDGVEAFTDVLGITPDTMINGHGVMAGPTGGNKAIGHIDFSLFEAAVAAGFEACGMTLPDTFS